ncbi:MAG: hypothetical protein HYY76_14695, partial [Acidobacteria bacterium]|nr:hypothetical protein [Acidobacteriota bacterium]
PALPDVLRDPVATPDETGWTVGGRLQCLWVFVTERRCREILDTARAGAARFPHAVKALRQDALARRERRARGGLSPHGFAVARGRLEARADRVLAWKPTAGAQPLSAGAVGTRAAPRGTRRWRTDS